jgi:hypothetical protein
MVPLFYDAMQAGKGVSRESSAWFAQADHAGAAPRAWRSLRALRDEDGATSGRAVIVSTLFLVVLASALLIGGHAALDPLLQSAIEARHAKGIGDVVYPMPDGIYCRHLSFDNTTSEIAETAIERCPDDLVGQRVRASRGFAWGH